LRTPLNGSVAKAFTILKVLAASGREMTATEVAQTIGTNLPTVHRFLVTLESLDIVSRTQQGRFQLGMALADLGDKVEGNKLLVGAVRPHLDAIAAAFREVAHCAVRSASHALNVAQSLPDRSLLIGRSIGETYPLHCTSVGKILLAALAPAARDRLVDSLPLERFTESTITDPGDLRRALIAIERQGYAIDDEEWEHGLRSVALPLRNGKGKTIAAIALSAPASRLDDAMLDRARRDIAARVQHLEHGLFTESRVFPQKARPRGSFPHLKRVDDFIFVSGTSARRPDDTFEGIRIDADGKVTIDIRRQTRAVFENIRDMLAGMGADLSDLVEVQAYLIEMQDYDAFNEAYSEFFGFEGPTRTTVGVRALPHPHQGLMVRAIAYKPLPQFEESDA
jgi:2-aminomuconate deaminase